MQIITHIKQLLDADRNFDFPFKLPLADKSQVVSVQESLRNLPGKRLTAKGVLDQKDVIVKIFFDPKSAFRHGLRDMMGVIALERARLPTSKLLYAGSAYANDVYVLVLEYLPGENLGALWPRLDSVKNKEYVLQQLMLIIAAQHERGLLQDDLHLDNFIVSSDKLHLIDGDQIKSPRGGKPLSKRASIASLAVLCAQFPIKDLPFLVDAFDVYLAARQWKLTPLLFFRFECLVKKARDSRVKKHLQKIFRECTAIISCKSRKARSFCSRKDDSIFFRAALSNMDEVLAKTELLKDGNTCTVGCFIIDKEIFVIKRYNLKSTWHAVKRAFGKTRARKSWQNAHRLHLLGISSLEPIALFERRQHGLNKEAYFVSRYVSGVDLDVYLKDKDVSDEHKSTTMRYMADLFEDLYEARISHGDMKATNFLVVNKQPVVIDLDAMRQHKFSVCFQKAWQRDMRRFMSNWSDLPEIKAMFEETFKAKDFTV